MGFKFEEIEEQSFPFTHKNKNYILKEPSGGVAKQYTNARGSCVVFDKEGKPAGVKNVGNLTPLLVSMCVFELRSDGSLSTVGQPTVESWPNRMQQELFEKAKEIGGLNDEDPAREQFVRACGLPSCPVDLRTFRDWAGTLSDENYSAFKKFLSPTDEEEAKNEQSDTMTG